MLVGSRQKLRNHDLNVTAPNVTAPNVTENVTVDGRPLSRVSSFKYLRLYIDENLTWHNHTSNVLQRVLSRVRCLYRLNPIPES